MEAKSGTGLKFQNPGKEPICNRKKNQKFLGTEKEQKQTEVGGRNQIPLVALDVHQKSQIEKSKNKQKKVNTKNNEPVVETVISHINQTGSTKNVPGNSSSVGNLRNIDSNRGNEEPRKRPKKQRRVVFGPMTKKQAERQERREEKTGRKLGIIFGPMTRREAENLARKEARAAKAAERKRAVVLTKQEAEAEMSREKRETKKQAKNRAKAELKRAMFGPKTKKQAEAEMKREQKARARNNKRNRNQVAESSEVGESQNVGPSNQGKQPKGPGNGDKKNDKETSKNGSKKAQRKPKPKKETVITCHPYTRTRPFSTEEIKRVSQALKKDPSFDTKEIMGEVERLVRIPLWDLLQVRRKRVVIKNK